MDPQQARVLALNHAVNLAVAGTNAADILADAAKYAEFLLGRVVEGKESVGPDASSAQ